MDNSFFPIRLGMHIVLALLAFLVFGLQFIRYRRSHHLVLAVALPCTLLPYLSDSLTFFYIIGIFVGASMLCSFILAHTVDRPKEHEQTAELPFPGQEADSAGEDEE